MSHPTSRADPPSSLLHPNPNRPPKRWINALSYEAAQRGDDLPSHPLLIPELAALIGSWLVGERAGDVVLLARKKGTHKKGSVVAPRSAAILNTGGVLAGAAGGPNLAQEQPAQLLIPTPHALNLLPSYHLHPPGLTLPGRVTLAPKPVHSNSDNGLNYWKTYLALAVTCRETWGYMEDRLRGRRRVFMGIGLEEGVGGYEAREGRKGLEKFWEKRFEPGARIEGESQLQTQELVDDPAAALVGLEVKDPITEFSGAPGVLDPRGGVEEDLGVKDWMEFSRWTGGEQRCVVRLKKERLNFYCNLQQPGFTLLRLHLFQHTTLRSTFHFPSLRSISFNHLYFCKPRAKLSPNIKRIYEPPWGWFEGEWGEFMKEREGAMERILPSARDRVFLNPQKWAPPFPVLEELHFQCYKHQRQHIFKYLTERYTFNRYQNFCSDLTTAAPRCTRLKFDIAFMGNAGVNLATLGRWGRWLGNVVNEEELGVEKPRWKVEGWRIPAGVEEDEEEEQTIGPVLLSTDKGKGKGKSKDTGEGKGSKKKKKNDPYGLTNMVKAHPNEFAARHLPNNKGVHPDGYDPAGASTVGALDYTFDPLKATDASQLEKGMPYGTRIKEIVIDGREKRRYNTFKYMKRLERQRRDVWTARYVDQGFTEAEAKAKAIKKVTKEQNEGKFFKQVHGHGYEPDADVNMDEDNESEDEEHAHHHDSDDEDSSNDGDGYGWGRVEPVPNDDRDFDYAANKAFDPAFKRWKLEGKGMREALIIRVQRWSTFKEPVEDDEEEEREKARQLAKDKKDQKEKRAPPPIDRDPTYRAPYSKYNPPPPPPPRPDLPLYYEKPKPLKTKKTIAQAKNKKRRIRGLDRRRERRAEEANQKEKGNEVMEEEEEEEKPKQRRKRRQEQVIKTREVVIKIYASEWMDTRTNDCTAYVTQLVDNLLLHSASKKLDDVIHVEATRHTFLLPTDDLETRRKLVFHARGDFNKLKEGMRSRKVKPDSKRREYAVSLKIHELPAEPVYEDLDQQLWIASDPTRGTEIIRHTSKIARVDTSTWPRKYENKVTEWMDSKYISGLVGPDGEPLFGTITRDFKKDGKKADGKKKKKGKRVTIRPDDEEEAMNREMAEELMNG